MFYLDTFQQQLVEFGVSVSQQNYYSHVLLLCGRTLVEKRGQCVEEVLSPASFESRDSYRDITCEEQGNSIVVVLAEHASIRAMLCL